MTRPDKHRTVRLFEVGETEDTIPGRFARIAATHPDRVAIVGREETLTYAELDTRSDWIADRIVGACGRSNMPVAVVLPQGSDACVAILSVLKAGKFYVPLDSQSPRDWLATVVEDVAPELVLTDAKHDTLARSLARGGTRVLSIVADDAPAPSVDRERADSSPDITPDSTCYVYFTSGTTGAPKGVMDCHRNVLHNVMRYTNSLSIVPSDRLTLLQPIEFSGSVSSLFCALLNGACVFPLDLRRENAASAARWFAENEITIYHSVPTIFRSLVDAVDRETAFPSVRVVRLEGDQASIRDIERFQRRFKKGSVLVNGLGMTEAGIVCQYFVDHHAALPTHRVPVGNPCEGMDVSVITTDGKQASIGEPGVIEVTSRFLASGYWKQPDETAGVFRMADSDDGRRVYRTGDLGRIREDGAVEHLGRADTRVRLDGRWIEPSLVEDALVRAPGVREAAVAVRGEKDEGKRLVGYVALDSDEPLDSRSLRVHLLKLVSPHSVPSRFVKIEQLPLTANGKVDRTSLPDPGRVRPDLDVVRVLPSGMLQQKLVDVWEDILGVDGIGVRDDFFELGGSSMAALEMMGQIEALYDRSLAPEVLMPEATIERLSEILLQDSASMEPVVSLTTQGSGPSLFFLHGAHVSGGMYCLELSKILGTRRPFVIVHPAGLAGDPIPSTYSEMAENHIAELKRVQPEGPYILSGRCNGGMVAYEMARQLRQRGESVPVVVMIEASASNLRFRSLRKIIGVLKLLGVGAPREEMIFLRIRALTLRMRRRTRMSHGERIQRPRVRTQHDRSALLSRPPSSRDVRPGGQPNSIADRWQYFRRHYRRVDHLCFPEPYEGPVVLLWPDQITGETAEEARKWWQRVCPHIDVRPIPGDAVTCVTRHMVALADAMNKAMLDYGA